MSPVLGPARRTVLLLGIALLASLAFAFPVSAQDTNETADANETATGNETDTNATGGEAGAGGSGGSSDFTVPGDAPAPAEGGITRFLTFSAIDEGPCPGGAPAPCWDVTTLVANPGDVVVLRADLTYQDLPHNLHIIEPGSEPDPAAPGPKSRTAPNAVHTLAMLVPEDGELTFICDVHPHEMVAKVVTPEAAASAGGAHASVPAMGVHFLAYWVGVIAFAILFIVYGLTFFLFKYNETRATTDHWDRSETPGESKRLAAIAPILAVVLAVGAIAGIVYVVMR